MGEKVASLFIEIGADGSAATRTLQGVQTELKNTKSTAESTMMSMGKAFALLGTMAVTAKKAYDLTVKSALDYNMAIKQFSRVTGMSMEESSRMTQIVDDMGVTTEDLQLAFSMLARKGIDPTIENIGRLSDSYLALAPGAERAQFASENFGRSYQAILPLLEMGSKRIDEATASVNGLLIATDKDYAATERYNGMMDELDDTTLGLKVSVGNLLIPELLREVEWAKLFVSGAKVAAEKTTILDEVFGGLSKTLFKNVDIGGLANDWLYGWLNLEPPAEKNTQELAGAVEGKLTPALREMAHVTKNGQISIKGFGSISDESGELGSKAGKKISGLARSIQETEWAATSAVPWLEQAGAYFVNKNGHWTLQISVNGQVPTDWYSDWQDLEDSGWTQHLEDQQEFFGMANGGNYSPGAMMVGERGPELMFPGRSGQVISNEEIVGALVQAMRGVKNSTNNYNLNVNSSASAGELIGEFAIFESMRGH